MKKTLITFALLAFSFTIVTACSCPPIKGLNGKYPGISTADSIWKNTLLIEIHSISDSGITAKILVDYHDKLDFETIFIENGNPGVYCIHSTDKFKIGETYLISPYSFSLDTKSTSLPTCWESFVNVGLETIVAQIIDAYYGEKTTWTIEQIERKLNIQIPENYR